MIMAANITTPTIIRVKNAAGVVVVPVARSLKFIGAIVVTSVVAGEAVIDGPGGGGGIWDVLGNAGGGLKLGTTTADSFSFIANNIEAGGFTAGGNLYVNKAMLFLDPALSGFYNSFVSPAMAASVVYTLPATDGGAGQVLSTNGGGVLSWINSGGGGGFNPTAVPFADGGGNLVDDVADFFYNSGTKILYSAGLGFLDSGSGFSNIFTSPVLAADVNYTLPATDGAAGYVLATSGAGVLSWVSGGGGGPIAGTADTIPIFNGAGLLSSTSKLSYVDTNCSFAFGFTAAGGVVTGGAPASMSLGKADGAGSIIQMGGAASTGCLAIGYALNGGVITSGALNTSGCFSHGFADGIGSYLKTQGHGSYAQGYALTAGFIQATSEASQATGIAQAGGSLRASASASFVHGSSSIGGIESSADSATVFGKTVTGATINNGGIAAFLHAYSSAFNSVINAADGMFVSAMATSGNISVFGGNSGALFAYTTNVFNINVTSDGTFAHLVAEIGTCDVRGFGAFVSGDNNFTDGKYVKALGIGIKNQNYNCLIIGQYNVIPVVNHNTYVNVEPAFVIGIGSGDGSRLDGFRVDKDGRQITYASEVHSAIKSYIVDPGLLDARLDRTAIVLTDTIGHAAALQLPQGEDGLEFFIKNAGINYVINLTVTGGDAIDPTYLTLYGATVPIKFCAHFQYLSGIWWALSTQ